MGVGIATRSRTPVLPARAEQDWGVRSVTGSCQTHFPLKVGAVRPHADLPQLEDRNPLRSFIACRKTTRSSFFRPRSQLLQIVFLFVLLNVRNLTSARIVLNT
jgi:hypothetical protein